MTEKSLLNINSKKESTMLLEQYGQILDMARNLCGSAHVAGGAVRDTILQRPVKDIDLFLDDVATDDAARLLRSKFGYVKVGEWAQYEMFSDPVVVRLAKFEKADEIIPVCLIGLRSPLSIHENIERFDFGICMAAWDGRDIITTDKFDEDRARETFTLWRADNQPQFAYSMVRFQKLTRDRYAGWRLAVRPEFEHLAREHAFKSTWYRDDEDRFGVNMLKPKDR